MNLRLFLKASFWTSLSMLVAAQFFGPGANAQSSLAVVRGETCDPGGLLPMANAQVWLHSLDGGGGDRSVVSRVDGSFLIQRLKPGRYQLLATKEGFASSSRAAFDLKAGQRLSIDVPLGPQVSDSPASQKREAGSFLHRLVKAYAEDWKGSTTGGTDPARRGSLAPVDGPPFPFSDWPYGGSVVIGAPWTQSSPLMQALWSGPHGEAWKKSGVQIYGWLNAGCNVSTSDKSRYANFPEAYAEVSDACLPDQEVLYIERQPDTVQKDHFDWGFRFTNLYGIDYRFTTAKGYFSRQLLGKNYEYGYDLVMAYVDLYFPHAADGMNVRIGRYISLPDIEAQLAPNNYTYSHSLLYTFDAYTQTGINATVNSITTGWFKWGFRLAMTWHRG
jgi:Putative beta-barrel porin-2, OmpL-like. bbp2/Carboxypeptidase regulatory-like domain